VPANRLVPTPSASTETAPTEVVSADEVLYDTMLERLHEVCGRAVRDMALAAGRTVIDGFFDGDESAFQAKSRYKSSKFTAFVQARAEQLDAMGLNPITLRNYVRAHIVWCGLPPVVQQGASLSALVELARLPDSIRRAQLAVAAHREGWPIRQLRAALDAELAALAAPDGPDTQPAPAILSVVKRWEHQTTRWQVEPSQLAALPPEDKTRVRKWIRDARARLHEMEEALRA
jgi:hypothetical protein